MEIKIKNLNICVIIYMYLAVVIFFIGWLQPIYAALSCFILGIGIFMGMRSWSLEEEGEIYLSKRVMVIGLTIILFMGWHTGIGAFTSQTGDWGKHNAVLSDLIKRRWPVIYYTEYGDSMLSYYIGYYLIPAVVGKLTESFRMAEVMEFILLIIGLGMVWMLIIRLCNIKEETGQLLALALMFLYGGMLTLGQTVCGSLYPENYSYGSSEWMNPESVVVQYTSNWFLLKWVPNQTIVPWMATVLVLLKKHKIESYVMIGLPVLLYSGFAMVGIAVMMAGLAVYEIYKNREDVLRRIFSLSNVLLTVVTGGILILYYCGNVFGEKPEFLEFHLLNYGQKKFFYFIFCFFMFGYYAFLLFKENKKNVVYWLVVLSLCAYPLFSMGVYNDFTMRTSIPALFTLMILVIRFLLECPYKKGEDGYSGLLIRKTLLTAGLVVGMMYPLLDVRQGVINNKIGEIYSNTDYLTLEMFANPVDEELGVDLRYNYYSYDLDHDWFYLYLAK